MAKAIKTERTNINFTPTSPDDISLFGRRFMSYNGDPHVEVTYQLTEEELKEVAETGLVHMYYRGNTVQPQLLSTEVLDG